MNMHLAAPKHVSPMKYVWSKSWYTVWSYTLCISKTRKDLMLEPKFRENQIM